MTVDGGVTGGGVKAGMWVCFAIVVAGAGLALLVFVLGGAKLQRPDLKRWQEGEDPAWDSPPLFAVPHRLNAAPAAASRPQRQSDAQGDPGRSVAPR